jgi:hypothetical protein
VQVPCCHCDCCEGHGEEKQAPPPAPSARRGTPRFKY